MSLAYILDGGLNDPRGSGTDLYESFPAIRRLYAQVADWTQTPVERFLSWDLPVQREYREVGAIRQAAMVFGLCDLLSERGVGPAVVAGLSFGNMIGACLAGAIDRADLFRLLVHLRGAPDPPGPPQAVAALFTPAELPPDQYLGRAPDGVYVAAELGVIAQGRMRLQLLSGYRAAIEELSRRLPPGALEIPDGVLNAYHSPLYAYMRDFLEQGLADIDFRDPVLPLCSCIEPKMLTSAAEVRELFTENLIRKVSVPYLAAGIERHGADLALVIGSAQVNMFVDNLPVPMVHVEQPEHLIDALTAISELGIPTSVPRA